MTTHMTIHWAHVTASYVLVLGAFLALGLGAALRYRAAKRSLAALDQRAGSRATPRNARAGAPR